jgi:hypothetical protein
MTDEFDRLQADLRSTADGFRPRLHPDELAAAGRRRQRRRNAAWGATGAAALMLAASLVGGTLLTRPSSVVPAAPATATPSPSATSTPSQTSTAISAIETTVPTRDWRLFSSPEYPITFRYPAGWTIEAGGLDGCDTTNCVLIITPPRHTKAAAIELIRNGFEAEDSTGGSVDDPSALQVLGALPEVVAWSAKEGAQASQAVVVQTPKGDDHAEDYALSTAGDLSQRISFGDRNAWPDRPQDVFLFSTNVGNIGGSYDKAGRETVIAILASARSNDAFHPTQPEPDAAGKEAVKTFTPMATPVPGAVEPGSNWETLKVTRANLSLRHPSNWKVTKADGGIIWIKAPSGYILDVLTNGDAESCDAGVMPGSETLATTGLVVAGTDPGPVEILWENGGEFPVWVGLAQRSAMHACFQRYLNYGGKDDVYVGSADNSANPTKAELDQALAILASVQRLP